MLPPVLKTAFLVHDSAPSGVWAADQATLEFLFQTVTSESHTLEIGAGLTTVLFALKGARHTCVVPVQAEVERIQAHCAREGVDCSRIQFVIDASERALPQL